MIAKLNCDITKRWVTAKAGDEVKIIADHLTCFIVEDQKGIRFTVQKNQITHE